MLDLLGYAAFFGTTALTFAVMALGLNLQWGQTGLFNVGVAGFVAVGAYASAILTTPPADMHIGGFGLPILPDTLPNFPGPLAGVLAGLEQAARAGYERVAVVPCDTPFLPVDLVARLRAAAGEEGGAVTVSGGRRHPAVALWPVRLGQALRIASHSRAILRASSVNAASIATRARVKSRVVIF